MTTKQGVESNRGLLLKDVGGRYTVRTGSGELVECRARGLFRLEKISPLAGDQVELTWEETGEAVISAILPRKNTLVRPPLANLDKLFLVVSLKDPAPNTLVIDKLTAIAEKKGIEPVLVLNKIDLEDPTELQDAYRKAGFAVYTVCGKTGEGIEPLRAQLAGGICAFTGNTGAGKSSLLNRIAPELALATGEISKKLGRGRHTTRTVELFPLAGGYTADTPGFSSVDLGRYEVILKEELAGCFREFAPHQERCRFAGCLHVGELGCAVAKAVEDGEIPPSRYRSYRALYEEVKDLKEWQVRPSKRD